MGSVDHWQAIDETRDPTRVGWYEPIPEVSRRLVLAAIERGARSVIDIGGGASSLVDQLLEHGVERVAVLDLSEAGPDVARRRLGSRAREVEWIVGDVTTLDEVGRFDVHVYCMLARTGGPGSEDDPGGTAASG